MSEILNPYSTPQSNLTAGLPEEEFGEIRIFSIEGRIGRLRYLSYLAILSFSIGAAGLLLVFLFGMEKSSYSVAETVVLIIPFLLIFGVSVCIIIQRLHDMNFSGWFALLFFVPLLNMIVGLVLSVVPGTPTRNDFGSPPPPNTLLVKMSAGLFVMLIILGELFGFLQRHFF